MTKLTLWNQGDNVLLRGIYDITIPSMCNPCAWSRIRQMKPLCSSGLARNVLHPRDTSNKGTAGIGIADRKHSATHYNWKNISGIPIAF